MNIQEENLQWGQEISADLSKKLFRGIANRMEETGFLTTNWSVPNLPRTSGNQMEIMTINGHNDRNIGKEKTDPGWVFGKGR